MGNAEAYKSKTEISISRKDDSFGDSMIMSDEEKRLKITEKALEKIKLKKEIA